MCSLSSNKLCDEELKMLGHSQAKKFEDTLSRLAADDSIERADGLDGTLDPITSWLHDPVLCSLRKKRMGRHRAYISGHHSQCHYRLFYMKMNKKEEKDREEEKAFQSKILKALSQPETRILAPPIDLDVDIIDQVIDAAPLYLE